MSNAGSAVAQPEPGPAKVRYNDWRGVRVPPLDNFEPWLPITVVVPYFEAQRALTLTLAALEGQTYPRGLFEVIVVDDGSRSPPRIPAATLLDVAVLRQERRGFGLARARNYGARAARHDILVFLDGDMLADSRMLAAHARWHYVVADALTLGLRSFVDVHDLDASAIHGAAGGLRRLFENRPTDEDWREAYLALTDDLASRHDAPFRAMSGCNFAMRKSFYHAVGGCDESFTQYGLEDTELAYRAHVRGGLLVPVRESLCWHQGRWAAERTRKRAANRAQRDHAANLIAHPAYRDIAPGRLFDVPRYVVTVPVGDEKMEQVAETVDAVLADPETDLAVRVEFRRSDRARDVACLQDRFSGNPRTQIAPSRCALDQLPASPFHLTVPPAAIPAGGIVRRLASKLNTAVSVTATLADGTGVAITRAWAMHRARRAGGSAADYGAVRQVQLGERGLRGWLETRYPRPPGRLYVLHAQVRWLLAEAAHIRNARSLLVFGRRFLHRLGQRRKRG